MTVKNQLDLGDQDALEDFYTPDDYAIGISLEWRLAKKAGK